MAKDDYYAIAYYILSYLYNCLKRGEAPDEQHLSLATYPAAINEYYRNYVYIQLAKGGYIDGVLFGDVPILGRARATTVVKSFRGAEITPTGIDYLQNNSTMAKTWEKICEAGGVLFSAISAFGTFR